MVPKLLGVTPHRAAQDLGFYALMEDIMALYVDHVANLKARRHSLLRRLGWLAAPQKCGDHQPRVRR